MKKLLRKDPLPEDRANVDAALEVAADMLADNARESIRDDRVLDAVADTAEGVRRAMGALYDVVELARARGISFEEMASHSHLSPEYLEAAFAQFDRGMWAQPGPDKNGREPWPVLG
ncbi:hypothetical protein [Streptomyces melanogenes]|uniref:hypothetical protein n=1 Tax=Streptomyces melanogenes TaxID=67326 RepID=UPI0037BC39C6